MCGLRAVWFALGVFVFGLPACQRETGRSEVAIRQGVLIGDDRDNVAIRTVALVTRSKLESGQSFCTGSIVAPDMVLTAAHCLVDGEAAETLVVFARTVKGAPLEKIRPVLNWKSHEEFNPAAALDPHSIDVPNDIALLRFEGSLPEPYVVTPILRDILSITNKVTLAGYGLASESEPETIGFLRAVDVSVIATDFLRKVMETLGEIGAQALSGDSGGPALVFLSDGAFVAGVDSTGSMRGSNSYTGVPYYADWIDQGMDELRNSTRVPAAQVKLNWNTPDLARSLEAQETHFKFVATNRTAFLAACRMRVKVLRSFMGTQISYDLLDRLGNHEAEFVVDPFGYGTIEWRDPQGDLNESSRLVEISFSWTCNEGPRVSESVRTAWPH